MIREFQTKSKTTIYKFLAKMGKNPKVYSEHFSPFNQKHELNYVWVYATRKEVVIVSIDHFRHAERELCDDWLDSESSPMYLGKDEQERVSPVWRLKQSADEFVRQLKESGCTVPRLWCVLITRNKLVNYRDMAPMWEKMGVTVYHDVKGMRISRKLPTNPDSQLEGCQYFHEYDVDKTDGTEEMLNDFIKKYILDNETTEDSNEADAEKENADEVSHLFDYEPFEDDDACHSDDDANHSDDDASEASETNDEAEEDDLPEMPDELMAERLLPMPHAQQALQQLVGCNNIKQRMEELMSLTRYNQMMKQMNPNGKRHRLSLHSIFFGRPGTGKTTVCKIMGGLFKEAGVLSKGHVVVCNRATFVGNLWGDEEKRVHAALKAAKGGVLMIDEAYLLNSGSPNDPGKNILPLLMELLADEQQRDIAVVLCGYKAPMKKLLELNPGLESRFPNRFEFEDFSLSQLLDITLQRIGEYEYHFTPTAWEKYKELLSDAYQKRNPDTWGNARFVANQLERIYTNHAKRCVKKKGINKAAMLRITPADIQPIDVPTARRAIGF